MWIINLNKFQKCFKVDREQLRTRFIQLSHLEKWTEMEAYFLLGYNYGSNFYEQPDP